MRYFILTPAHEVQEVEQPEWMEWFENRSEEVVDVASDEIGESRVSTIFLGLAKEDEGEPLLWESMVFGGPMELERTRCSGTWEDAEKMHHEMFIKVRNAEQQTQK